MLDIDIEKLPTYLIGEERGIEKGEHKRAIMVAKQLFKLNMPLEQIAQISGLSVKELEGLDKSDE